MERISVLDGKGEVGLLSEDEIDELHGLTSDLHSLARVNPSICWQQSRLLWLKDGDANSKYFHSILVGRLRGNTLSFIMVDGVLVEGVQPIRADVFSHFASHYKAPQMDRPSVENLIFSTLSYTGGASLIKPFCVEEVKAVVWNCNSYKSPGPVHKRY